MVLLLMFFVACSTSGLNQTDTAPDSAAPVAAQCPHVGSYKLVALDCGTFPFLEDYNSERGLTTLDIGSDETGACIVNFKWTDGTCSETEEWRYLFDGSGTYAIDRKGIIECLPDACTFIGTDNDPPCSVGDRKQTGTINIVAKDGGLEIVNGLRHAWDGCQNIEDVTQWSRL